MLPRTRGQLVFAVSFAVAVYFLYTAAIGAIRNHQLGEERDQAEAELRELKDERTYLQAVLAYVASDTYVEQQARRELGYARPGEIPFVVTGPRIYEEPEDSANWWERMFPR